MIIDVPDQAALEFVRFVVNMIAAIGVMWLIGLAAAVLYAVVMTIKDRLE